MNEAPLGEFAKTIWKYYQGQGRHDLPWRRGTGESLDPYMIMVSEIMLQQTQVGRVVPKFQQFMARFPTLADLAAADLGQVLVVWSGLGYNRRAKFLWQAARQLAPRPAFPQAAYELQKLPGIGPNTAAAILVYAYNQPLVFVETNIRTVFIHHFFADQTGVADAEIRIVLEQTLPRDRPRQWFWALMDYGTHLKQEVGNAARASRSYARQSKFEGSLRQVRGQVIRLLTTSPLTNTQLVKHIHDERLGRVLEALQTEKLIQKTKRYYHLP